MDQATSHDDLVRVATCATPTEAHLLKGVLEAAGLNPVVFDANIVQANTWMTQAVGGVRVMVPGGQIAAANEAIEAFHRGAFQLEGEDAAAPEQPEQLATAIFSPDRAILLSFLLTPVFGACLQLANASALGRAPRARDWVWMVLLAGATISVIYVLNDLSKGPFLVFRASYILAAVTVLWYFFAGQDQSRFVIQRYGSKFPSRSMAKQALVVAGIEFMVGWLLSQSR